MPNMQYLCNKAYLILSQKILDRVLLVSVDPTGQDQEQQLPGPEHEVHG